MNRLKMLRRQQSWSQSELASMLGVAQNTISNWENGSRLIDQETLVRISKLFKVSVDYLLGLSDSTAFPSPPPSTGGVWIPVLGEVIAGVPIEAVEEILDYEEITMEMAAGGDHFALQVKGDSMEPRISEGDVVIVRKQECADTGDVAVVLVNGDAATVKKIKIGPKSLTLYPFNPKYDPMIFTLEECEQLPVQIIGKVVELRGKF